MTRLLIFLLLSLTAMTSAAAQKYGHLNFANLLSEMPGTKAGEAELKAYNDELTAKGEKMVADLKARIQEVEAQVEDLAPTKLNELKSSLAADREKIGNFERQMGVDVQKKRQQLLGPLIEEARKATRAVAEENGYQFVFDTSQFNTVLYGSDGDDIMPLVKAKLGM